MFLNVLDKLQEGFITKVQQELDKPLWRNIFDVSCLWSPADDVIKATESRESWETKGNPMLTVIHPLWSQTSGVNE